MSTLKGFTFIEFVIVLIIISVLVAIAIPMWPGTSINASAQADQVAADILYTQTLSLTTGERHRFVRLSTTTYQIQDSTGTAIRNPGAGATTITLNSGITFGTFTNLPNNLIVFDGKGIPYTTTAIPGTTLAAIASIPIVSASLTKTIQIRPTTGWISVS